jgi:hypothetical protein
VDGELTAGQVLRDGGLLVRREAPGSNAEANAVAQSPVWKRSANGGGGSHVITYVVSTPFGLRLSAGPGPGAAGVIVATLLDPEDRSRDLTDGAGRVVRAPLRVDEERIVYGLDDQELDHRSALKHLATFLAWRAMAVRAAARRTAEADAMAEAHSSRELGLEAEAEA